MMFTRSELFAPNDDKLGVDFKSNYEVNEGVDAFNMERNGIILPTYVISSTDLDRPDIISKKVYGSNKYWWLLMKANRIFDPFNDLYVGQKLKVVPMNLLDNFYTRAKKSVGEE